MDASNLQYSKHALKRQLQRRICREQVETVMTYGIALPAGRGAICYHMTKQRCKELIAEHRAMIDLLLRSEGVKVIADDAEVITEYHETKYKKKRRRVHVFPMH